MKKERCELNFKLIVNNLMVALKEGAVYLETISFLGTNFMRKLHRLFVTRDGFLKGISLK